MLPIDALAERIRIPNQEYLVGGAGINFDVAVCPDSLIVDLVGHPAIGCFDGSGEARPLLFDAKSADQGWKTLDTFEVVAGEVRVEVTDETDGKIVVADAIRWTPVTRTTSGARP